MARVRTLSPIDFDPTLADALGHPRAEDRVALGSMTAWATTPPLALAFLAFQRACERAATLTPRLRELVRLRIAFHNQCRSCMAVRSTAAIDDGMSDGAVCSLERPDDAADLTAAEKAALKYADLLATDHLAIDDAVFDRLRQHFDDDQVIELGVHIATCVGFGRLAMSWDLVDDLPDGLRDKRARATPWAHEPILR